MATDIKKMSKVLKALSNENRLQIIQWLMNPAEHFPKQIDGDLDKDGVCLGAIPVKIGLSQPTVTTYMQTLENAGLVTSKRIKNWTFYKLNENGVNEVTDFLQEINKS